MHEQNTGFGHSFVAFGGEQNTVFGHGFVPFGGERNTSFGHDKMRQTNLTY